MTLFPKLCILMFVFGSPDIKLYFAWQILCSTLLIIIIICTFLISSILWACRDTFYVFITILSSLNLWMKSFFWNCAWIHFSNSRIAACSVKILERRIHGIMFTHTQPHFNFSSTAQQNMGLYLNGGGASNFYISIALNCNFTVCLHYICTLCYNQKWHIERAFENNNEEII